jgi:hypothetical protein
VLSRFRAYLDSLEPEIRQRAFAAHTNPRLGEATVAITDSEEPAEVVRFPGP